MSLRLRRGTDGERLAITPEAGELIFTTDTKTVYVGDGATQGGIIVSAGGVTLADLGDTNIVSAQDGDLLGYNASASKWEATRFVDTDITGSVFAKDSGVLVDANSGLITGTVSTDAVTASGTITANAFVGDITGGVTGDVVGDVTGNVVGNTTGYHTGDITGSVFAIDSGLMVDAINGEFFGNRIFTTKVDNTSGQLLLQGTTGIRVQQTGGSANTLTFNDTDGLVINGNGNNLSFTGTAGLDAGNTILSRKTDGNPILSFTRTESTGQVATEASIGRITFSKTDTDGTQTPFQIEVNKTYMNIFPNPTGTPDYTKFVQVWNNGKLQVGGEAGGNGYQGMSREPDAQLEVTGNIKVNGAFELLLGNMTTTERNALTAANGMIIYNTTDNKFQGYENGAWANLI